MEGICIGFAPGASALDDEGSPRRIHDIQPVEPLPASTDETAWHDILDIKDVSMRRSRRVEEEMEALKKKLETRV